MIPKIILSTSIDCKFKFRVLDTSIKGDLKYTILSFLKNSKKKTKYKNLAFIHLKFQWRNRGKTKWSRNLVF